MKSTSIFSILLSAFLVATLLAIPANAQGGRGGGMGMGGNMQQQGPLTLLNMPEVRRELQIGSDTMAKLTELVEDVMEEVREKTQSMMQDMRGGDRGNRQDMMAKVREQLQTINDEAMKDVKELLDEKQLKRLRELHIQRMSWAALEEDDVKKELGLSASQLDEIKDLRDKINSDRREMRQGMGGGGGRGDGGGGGRGGENREEMQEAQRKIQQTEEDGYKKILSSEQMDQFTKMQGAKFEFPRPGRGGRGGAGGQNRDDFSL